MKKSIFVLMLFLLIGSFVGAASLTLNASVQKVLSVSIDSSSVGFVLNTNGETKPLGQVTFISNSKNWIVKVYSDNGGKLTNSDTDTTDNSISYTFTMGSLLNNVNLLNTAPSLPTQTGFLSMTEKTAKTGDKYNLSITYSEEGSTFWSYDKGNYIDTIRIDIQQP